MRKTVGILYLAALIGGSQIAAGQAVAQSQSQSQAETSAKSVSSQSQAQKDSVAEAARKSREAQKNAPKAPVIFTNDNIGAAAGSATVNIVGNTPLTPASASAESNAGNAASGQSGQAGASGPASASSGNDAAAWRKKFADARAKLQQDQADLAIMQRELAQLRVQYYSDPSKALKQSVSDADVTGKQNSIDKKQKQIQADQQALSNLEDDLRKARGDASWARE